MTDVETVIAARDIAVAAVTTTAANVDLATQQADRAEVAASEAALGHTHTSGQVTDFVEAAQDAVAALLASGTGVSLSYNDAGNTLTVTGLGDPETMRDTIGAALVGIGVVSVAVNDAGDSITISSTATANDTDANLKARANHTGTQAISTITGLQAALDGKARAALTATRTTDATINNSVTLTNDTQLVIALEANATYEFRALLSFLGPSAADVAFTFTVPAGATGLWFSDGAATSVGSSGNTPVGRKTMAFGASDSTGTPSGAAVAAGPRGYVKTAGTAGNLTVQWAQNVLTVGDTILQAGSILIANRIA